MGTKKVSERKLAKKTEEKLLKMNEDVTLEYDNDPGGVIRSKKNKAPVILVNGERWFTYQQLSNILMCSTSTFYLARKKKKIQQLKIDGIRLYRLNGYM